MPDFNIDCEEIDKFLTRARTIDTFEKCQTVYELFGITNRNSHYADIERKIEAFGKQYIGNNAAKFKIFSKTVGNDLEVIKRVLKDHQIEYNNYLRENDPRVKQLRLHFDFCTKRDGALDSEEKSHLIEEGKEAGLTETEVCALIDQWVIETGVREVEARSDDSTSGKSFPDFAGKTIYEILGVADDAEYTEIKDAYEREHIKYNTSREKAKASARFYVVSEAWDCLKDPVKRREYDEKLRQPKTPPPTGKPRLVVERKSDYTFRDIRRGAVINVDKIVIKNPDGGLLQGTIKSDVSWLEPDRNKVLEKHEQELYVNILTSKIPLNDYEAEGFITIDTNGGTYSIPFRVILEGLEIAADRFRKTYVPLIAACAGLIASFSNSPILNFLIGAGSAGLIAYVFAKLAVKFFLNKGIDIFKLPRPLIQAAAVGVVILTIVSHYGGSSVFKSALVPARLPALDTKAKPPTPSINITKAVIAADLMGINQDPFGVDTSFPPGYKRLYYYVSYNGGIPDSTVLVSKWNKFGAQIREVQMTIKHASGIAWAYLDYDFQPGQYEVQIHANGQQLGRSPFNISDTQKAEEQQPSVSNNKKEGESKYTDNGNGTIKDKTTGLTWQQGENSAQGYNWYQASGAYDAKYNASSIDVCGSLSLAGSGWRLPTKDELFGLVDTMFKPTINTAFFSIAHASYYWSSTASAGSTDGAWGVYFGDGYVGYNGKSYDYYVRCVRGGQVNSEAQRAEEQQRERKAEAGKANATKEALAKAEAERQMQELTVKQREIDDYLSDGKRFFENGKYELSIAKMREVVRRDSNNREAKQYIRMASEKINNIKRQFMNPTFGGSE